MSRVKITAYYTLEDNEIDDDDSTGMTDDAYEELTTRLDDVGVVVDKIEPE